MKDKVIEQSQKFWQSLEKADSKGMREVCDPDCWFVHIGMSCGLDEEMEAFDKKIFQPTQIDIHGQEVREWGDTSVCMTDVGRILRTFKIKKNVEVTDNGKDDF